jgi:hypothetical protein
MRSAICAGLILSCWQVTPAGPAPRAARKSKTGFETSVKPVLTHYCYGCHGEKKKGDLDLRVYVDEASALKDRGVFEKMLKNLEAHEMPPENKPQPTREERERVTSWITEKILGCDCSKPDPGRVTLHRLNRAEYNNTIRDLVGVDFQPAEDFPQDDVGYGFDNIGDVLAMPPILLEKYLAAADKILAQAIVVDADGGAVTNQFEATSLDGTAPGGPIDNGMRQLAREGDVHLLFPFPREAEYVVRVRAYGEQAGPEPARMAVSIDGQEIKRFDVTAESDAPQIYETRVALTAGKKKVAAAYLNNYVNQKDPNPKNRDRNLVIDYLELVTPADPRPRVLPESHRRIFFCQPTPRTEGRCVRQILARFARRAYRRPVAPEEVERLAKLAELAIHGEKSFERGLQIALQAVLVSPHFLFRGEWQPDPNNPAAVHPINEFALASRLSYFLWSSMPDDELLAQAERGTLRRNLDAQVKRMLKDAKARALVDNFAGQWLQIRNLKSFQPDKTEFPDFDEPLRSAMQKETELFFEAIIREDRSILDFLDGDYTFVNERLARHYGIAGVRGEAFQKVSLQGTPRSGILSHASVLTITSNPTRTSPVKRGKWVLENLLASPPPPPPPDVPELKETKEAVLSGSLRQRMEQHRENALCASCHARMDPIGFGLENFDGIGRWRAQDAGFPIDSAGKLVTGELFKGPADLRAILVRSKKDDFIRCLSEKMLTYALGRGLEYYDKCATDQIAKGLAKHHYKFSSLILEVVKSAPFQMRRGEGQRLVQAGP